MIDADLPPPSTVEMRPPSAVKAAPWDKAKIAAPYSTVQVCRARRSCCCCEVASKNV
ncbi:hypothetical protein BJV82DRAFT_604146, partial [Fennellomyces sp. T-0311]